MNNRFSRRGLIKGVLGMGAAAAGARVLGPFVPNAYAQATETSHFVHIFFHGGINAIFTGGAKILEGKFGANGTNIKPAVAGGEVFTDADTFGTFSDFALQHWAAIPIRHGDANHTVPENANGGGELAIVRSAGNKTYLNELANAMGGSSPLKAALLGKRASGQYGVFRNWDKEGDVNITKVEDIKEALRLAGAEKPTNPDAADRGKLASTLAASKEISGRSIATNPGRLSPLNDAYDTAIDSLRQPAPPPVTFEQVDKAYNLGGLSKLSLAGGSLRQSFAAMLAGAELMIRASNTNVIHLTDFDPMWDFDAVENGQRSNARFRGESGAYNRLAPIKTFLDRMLDFPGKNVVVAISGEFVRETTGHGHGAGTLAAVFGKHVKPGITKVNGAVPFSNTAKFAGNCPNTKAFWAGIAAACKVPGQPFGPNPHNLLG